MTRRPVRSYAGFGILETLAAMFLVGLILGLVARGYQALSRLNLASYQMSQRMELATFLNRLSYEVVSALTVTTNSAGFSFERIDTSHVLNHTAPGARLPWPVLSSASATGLMGPAYRTRVTYAFVSSESRIERTAYSQTINEVGGVGEFATLLEPGGRVLSIDLKPKEMVAGVKARIFLPVVGQ